jgi:hypothetical protein
MAVPALGMAESANYAGGQNTIKRFASVLSFGVLRQKKQEPT